MAVPIIDSAGIGKMGSVGMGVDPSSLDGVSIPSAVRAYKTDILAASSATGVPPRLIAAVMTAESSGRADICSGEHCSPAGAIGAMQLMPGTAAQLHVNPKIPSQNIMGGAKYLSMLLAKYNGDYVRAVRAYNAGPGNENTHRAETFTETKNYQARVMGVFTGNSKAAPVGKTDGLKVPGFDKEKAGSLFSSFFEKLKTLFYYESPVTLEVVMQDMRTQDPQLYPPSVSDKQLKEAILAQNRKHLSAASRRELDKHGISDHLVFNPGTLRVPSIDTQLPAETGFNAFAAPKVALTAAPTVNTAQATPNPSMPPVYLPPRAV